MPTDNGRAVLITGGASGIGAAVAAEFARLGDAVTVLDRREPTGPGLGSVQFVAGDVTAAADNERAVAAAAGPDGGLDVLVTNAGVHDGGFGLLDGTPEDLERVMTRVFSVDVLGYVLGVRAAVDALRRRKGCVVMTLSDASFVVRGNGAGIAYTSAKHAALGTMRFLAADLAPDVRVNAVAPGGVITSLEAVGAGGGTRSLFTDPDSVTEAVRAFNPLHLMLRPDQIAPAYTFLASPAAAGMTGEVLRADGGLSLR